MADRDQQRARVALVTGAGRGIGHAIAVRLAKAGYDLIINDLESQASGSGAPAQQTADEIRALGRDAFVVPADVGAREDVEQLFDRAWQRFGRLDCVVSNAAFNIKKRIVDTDWKEAQRIFDVTMMGAFHVGQLAAQRMVAESTSDPSRRGQPRSILFIGSVHAELSVPFHTVYAMSKTALTQLCKSLAAEVVEHRINVNGINPGWIDTPGERAFITEEEIQAAAKQLPWGRLGEPDEIAELTHFLTSPAARYITGEIVTIDGGLRLFPAMLTKGL